MSIKRVIDSHIHFTNAGRADEIGGMLEKLGVEKFCSQSLVNSDRVNSNPECLYLKGLYPGRAYAGGALDYTKVLNHDDDAAADLARQVDVLRETGYDGMKMVEGKPAVYARANTPFDAPLFAPFFSRLAETKFPLVFHVGDPHGFWELGHEWSTMMGWNYAGKDVVALAELYRQVDAVLKANPGLTVIFAHFFFLAGDLERAGRYLAGYPNVHLDVTPGAEMFYEFSADPGKTRDFFIRWQDRIIYGTDVFIGSGPRTAGTDRYFEVVAGLREFFTSDRELDVFRPEDFNAYNIPREGTIRGITLPDEVLGKVFAGNFERLYGVRPREVNRELAAQECQRIRERAKKRSKSLEKVVDYFK